MITEGKTITDTFQIIKVMNNCETCHLAINDKETPYTVPMNFGFTSIKGNFKLYFCCDKNGKTVSLLKKNLPLSFSMTTAVFFVENDDAMKWETTYQSITGRGRVSFIENTEEKIISFKHIMSHYSDKSFTITEEDISDKTIFCVVLDSVSCRINPLKAI